MIMAAYDLKTQSVQMQFFKYYLLLFMMRI